MPWTGHVNYDLRYASAQLTEELVEVRVEAPDLAGGDDEREHFPVSIGSLPEVPGMAGDVQAAEDLRSDRLDASQTVNSGD